MDEFVRAILAYQQLKLYITLKQKILTLQCFAKMQS